MSDLDDKDFAIRAPYLEKIAGLEEILRGAERQYSYSLSGSFARSNDAELELAKKIEKLAEVETELASAYAQLTEIAEALHYPNCWDTAAYPTLVTAITEAYSGCSECERNNEYYE